MRNVFLLVTILVCNILFAQEKRTLTVYRNQNLSGGLIVLKVYANGDYIGKLPKNDFVRFEVPKGEQITIEFTIYPNTLVKTVKVPASNDAYSYFSVRWENRYVHFIETTRNGVAQSLVSRIPDDIVQPELAQKEEVRPVLVEEPTIVTPEDKKGPQVVLTSPSVTRGMKHTCSTKIFSVEGTVSDESGIFELLLNGSEVQVVDGKFSHLMMLAFGDNTITLQAKDTKLNVTTFGFTITRINSSVTATQRPVTLPAKIEQTQLCKGEYYALLIGVENYTDESINDLDNPIDDAQKLQTVLQNEYTFKKEHIILLQNPTKNEITAVLDNYYNKLTEDDNLLIFYAGHGYWDKSFQQGFWLAHDAERDNRGTWLSNGTIRDYMRAIPAKHNLLITDACFGGGIFKSRDAFNKPNTALEKLYDYPSRKAMTSGALSVVPDKSVFIEYLVKRLDQNAEKYMSSEQLFANFKIAVINNSPNGQIPQFGEVRETGDEGGDFIFIKK